MIELRDIRLLRSGGWRLEGLSWQLPDPGCYLLQGAGASGKSALCGLLGGCLPPQSGQVLIDGQSLYRLLGGYRLPVFRASPEDGLAMPETAAEYVEESLFQIGAQSSLADGAWPILADYNAQLRRRPLETMSLTERMLISVLLAAVIPLRLVVLDALLDSMWERQLDCALRLLKLAADRGDVFLVLASARQDLSPPFPVRQYRLTSTSDGPTQLVSGRYPSEGS